MPVSAASFGQIAVLLEVVTRDEHREISKEIHAHLRAGRPSSYARILLRRGLATGTVKQVLRRGSQLQSVRCDACGAAVPQEAMPQRIEYPCPGCGCMLLGFRAFARERAGAAQRAGGSGVGSRAPDQVITDGESQTVNFPQVVALPPPPRSPLEALATPRDDLDPDEVRTEMFREVFVLPPGEGRGEPRSDDETTFALGELADSDGSEAVTQPPTVGLLAPKTDPPLSRLAPASAPPAREAPPPKPTSIPIGGVVDPAKVGNFRILRRLGQGSMGNVYLGEDPGSGARVALKLLKPQFAADEEYLRRFHREAQAAAGERHENVVAVVGSGQDESLGHWIAFEYVDGGSLEDLLKRRGGSVPEDEAAKVGLGVARALEFTARRGIVHRDVKPANVLLTRDSLPKLADLGMARHLDLSTRVTAPGIVLGTPAYLAPEQAMGVEDIDGRADLYALGVCLWEMLTGRLPLDEGVTTEQLIVRHVDEDIPDVRIYKPSVSDGMAQVVAGLCAREREGRYPTAEAAAGDLERVIQGKPPLGAKGRHPPARRTDPPDKVKLTHPSDMGGPPAPPLARTLDAPVPGAAAPAAKRGSGCGLLVLGMAIGFLGVGAILAATWWFYGRHRWQIPGLPGSTASPSSADGPR